MKAVGVARLRCDRCVGGDGGGGGWLLGKVRRVGGRVIEVMDWYVVIFFFIILSKCDTFYSSHLYMSYVFCECLRISVRHRCLRFGATHSK